jgi:NADH-quinone oxidoreductase subunit A
VPFNKNEAYVGFHKLIGKLHNCGLWITGSSPVENPILLYMFLIAFDAYANDYMFLFYYFLFFLSVVLILGGLALSISRKSVEVEKASSYECGFEPFESFTTFNLNFFVVGLSFLIFDLELVFLYPWSLYCGVLGIAGFWVFLFFLFLLVLGFVYEWQSGALTLL